MYLEYYNLRESPFQLTSNPRFLFYGAGHREAMARLVYGLRERRGLIVLLGEPGTGKSTLISAALGLLKTTKYLPVTLDHYLFANERAYLAAILAHLELQAEGGENELLLHIRRALQNRIAGGEIPVLIVDEAQGLRPELLDVVRLLSNLEDQGQKLLTIILAGQLELATETLDQPRFQALSQRVAVRSRLRRFHAQETAEYVLFRLHQAGAKRLLFDNAALAQIHRFTGGIPRLVNIVADHALLAGYAAAAHTVNSAIVEKVGAELELQPVENAEGQASGTAISAPPDFNRVLQTSADFERSLSGVAAAPEKTERLARTQAVAVQ